MLIKKENTIKKENSKSCSVWEYEFPGKKLGIATALINGRYPEQGKVMNSQCETIYYVLDGAGIIHTEQGDFEIKKGDAFFLETGQWYWIEGINLSVAIVNAPAWFPGQYQNLP